MNDRCPFCGHAKATEGSEVYQCGTRWNEPEKLVRTHNCYNREIAKLRAVAEAAVDYLTNLYNPPPNTAAALKGLTFASALRAAGYLQPLTPPSADGPEIAPE